MIKTGTSFGLALLLVAALPDRSGVADTTDVSFQRQPPFSGTIEIGAKESVPDWPAHTQAPPAAPNIVLIMLDDVGFGDAGTFGGPVQTPALDQLAAAGLRYTQFHTTGVCSSTRAALLAGRNHHQVGFGANGASGFPGYNTIWKKGTVSMAEVLRRHGYSTAAFGKWHNTPAWEITPVGPFDRWPTGLGFEYFYGNMRGNGSQWEPNLWRNTDRVLLSGPRPPEYHLTADLVDDAIRWVQTHESLAPEKPYFVYLAPEAAHVPHHVPNAWIERYRGRFDQGWDRLREEIFVRQKQLGIIPADAELTPRPKELPAWTSLSPDQQRLYARQMEVFGGFLAHADYEVGRLLEVVRQGPHGDNTLILYIVGDNGDEPGQGIDGTDNLGAEYRRQHRSVADQLRTIDGLGGPQYSNAYAAGWAWAGSTPFQWIKGVASHFGGTRNPLIVSWPARIKERGGVRRQFAHVVDVAATVYEVTGIGLPSVVDGVRQVPLDGVSLAHTFDHATPPSRYRVQYFEMRGNRAIYEDGWMASVRREVPWLRAQRGELLGSHRASARELQHDRWELYHIDQDFSQAHDVAAQYPAKLKALQALFDQEARRNHVYPLGVGIGLGPPDPQRAARKSFTYYAGFPGGPSPNFGSPHRITARLIIPSGGAEGVIIASGSRFGGFTLYIKDNRLVYETTLDGRDRAVISARAPLPVGPVELAYEYCRDDAAPAKVGFGRLYVNGKLVAESALPHGVTGVGFVDIGQQSASPVSNAYHAPFAFNGNLEKVTVVLE